MSILVNRDTRLLVQGITGREGMFHAQQMQDYGTNVVGGVTPGKGGQTRARPSPCRSSTRAPMRWPRPARTRAYLRPGRRRPGRDPRGGGRRDQDDLLHHRAHPGARHAQGRRTWSTQAGARLVGPNCPGATSVGQAKVGIIPGNIHRAGHVGVVSRSGTLTYEVVEALTEAGIGQSTCVGIGGDPINGSNFIDILTLFRDDPDTHAVVLIGEIGGDAEERAADWIAQNMRGVPMASFIAGRTAPPGRRMGHAGAIISGGRGTAQSKVDALQAAGVTCRRRRRARSRNC